METEAGGLTLLLPGQALPMLAVLLSTGGYLLLVKAGWRAGGPSCLLSTGQCLKALPA